MRTSLLLAASLSAGACGGIGSNSDPEAKKAWSDWFNPGASLCVVENSSNTRQSMFPCPHGAPKGADTECVIGLYATLSGDPEPSPNVQLEFPSGLNWMNVREGDMGPTTTVRVRSLSSVTGFRAGSAYAYVRNCWRSNPDDCADDASKIFDFHVSDSCP